MTESGKHGGARVGHVIVAARNEGDRIAQTVAALREVFAGATVVVADDGSDDETAAVAAEAGAVVVSTGVHMGKGQAASLGAERALSDGPPSIEFPARPIVLLADADLAASAARLRSLAEAVAGDEADIAVAAFARRVGGGFGLALGFARWAIERRCGFVATAPISGQRALSYEALAAVAPFRDGFGMEIGMTVDAVRAGLRVREIELDLAHRATGKSLAGFIHRGRQLRDFMRVYRATAKPRAAATSRGAIA
jgi:glycosyltransferase involved in cell wall biosynthesis